jgi:hypothetical protein
MFFVTVQGVELRMLVIAKQSKLPIFTRGRVARVTTEGVVPGLANEWPDTSSTPLACWRVRVGLIQHVNSVMHEAVSVNLINNMSYELKNKQQLLWMEEGRWFLVQIRQFREWWWHQDWATIVI